ncbi:MAG: helix-turn-helix domain-containing protein [Salinibacter sp.]
MTIQQRFGQRLRARRQAQGLTQIELAAKADLHRNYVGDVERGVRNPSLASVDRLSRALNADPAELLGVSALWMDAAIADLEAAESELDALEAAIPTASTDALRRALADALARLRSAADDDAR